MNAGQIFLIAIVVIYVIGRRFAGSPVGSRTLLVPIALTGYGVLQLTEHNRLDATDVGLLVVECAVGVVAGAVRAMTIKLYPRDGHLWQRYTVVTLGVWVAMVALRLGFVAAGSAMGASLPTGATLMATFGLSLIAESLLVSARAAATGTPILPGRPRRESMRARRRARTW